MVNRDLFKNEKGQWITCEDFKHSLLEVSATECDVLFVHTDLSFGVMNPELNRKELCEILFTILMDLKVDTVVFPTFTFSFGNKQDFDVRTTPTKMGMLNEYARKLPEAKRSVDPMMSVVAFGKNKDILQVNGVKSLGEGSIFDNLHNTPNVRFVFVGTKFGLCGTHMHYVEEVMRVPYRYDMDFYGKTIDYDGNITEDHKILYVKYRDILPSVPAWYEEDLVARKIMPFSPLGNTGIYSISEKDMYREVCLALEKDVNVFLAEPYDTHPFVKDYQYGNVTTVQ